MMTTAEEYLDADPAGLVTAATGHAARAAVAAWPGPYAPIRETPECLPLMAWHEALEQEAAA